MILDDQRTYYDILDISPDANSQEVREAYVRIKSTYNRDNLVLYTLVSPEEREETLKKIEMAYEVLSNQEKRKEYDENHGILGYLDNPFAHQSTPKPQAHPEGSAEDSNIVSIDRVPPMEFSSQDPDILIPPSTDIEENPPANQSTQEKKPTQIPGQPRHHYARESDRSRTRLSPYGSRPTLPQIGAELSREIELETEWKGSFLKKIREAYKISIEELSNTTKITKSYLHAIESDDFNKLPAPVYVRGFITQIAKALKLVPERVVPVYMTRFKTTIEK